MTEKVYGYKEFPDKIDITDPCYDRNVWCRINNFQIPAGEYECYAQVLNDEETNGWGERISRIGIRTGKPDEYKEVCSICVDAGLAGFFINKPDFTDEEWMDFVHQLNWDKEVWTIDCGFFSSSGFGDGSYSVYAGYKDDELVDLYIEFIGEDNV